MRSGYRHQVLRLLKEQQSRYAPPERRAQQITKAEQLLREIEPERHYPYEYLCYRITGFRPESGPVAVLEGEEVRHDLQLFVEDLSATLRQRPEDAPEPVLTTAEVSRRYNVTPRTIARWRERGLVARRFVINGRAKVAFLESSVAQFVESHREQVERGGRFRQLTDTEREEIIHRARRMITASDEAGLIEVARRIAQKMQRSTETIRTTLKTYDREHPDKALFPHVTGPLDEDSKSEIHREYRRGVSVDHLVKQFGRTRSSIYRVINEMRARRLLGTKLEFIEHASFSEPKEAATILTATPSAPESRSHRKPKAPKGLPPYLASLYEVPLLSREQEAWLFRKMNFLKFKANQIRVKIEEDPSRAKTTDMDEIDRLQEEALAVKNQIIRANLRLVVSIAKRHVGPSNNFFELVSDGNMSLIRAVEKFDYSRGNKFSTYASWAIMKNFARTIPEENYRRDRFVTGHEEMFESAADNRSDEHEYESTQKRMQVAVKGMLDRLDDRERRIIISRYGLNGASEQTLEQLGRELGITKERVRQIESRAQDKLRRFAQDEKLELSML